MSGQVYGAYRQPARAPPPAQVGFRARRGGVGRRGAEALRSRSRCGERAPGGVTVQPAARCAFPFTYAQPGARCSKALFRRPEYGARRRFCAARANRRRASLPFLLPYRPRSPGHATQALLTTRNLVHAAPRRCRRRNMGRVGAFCAAQEIAGAASEWPAPSGSLTAGDSIMSSRGTTLMRSRTMPWRPRRRTTPRRGPSRARRACSSLPRW